MVDKNSDNKSGPSSLTFEELSNILAEYDVYYKQLKCEAKDKPDCYIGLRAEDDPTRVYKVTLHFMNKKKKTFHIRWPMYIQRENSFENISADSGRFVDAAYANFTEASFIAQHYNPTAITIKNNNYRPNAGQAVSSPYRMEGKSSSEFEARMQAALQMSIGKDFPEEKREGNPGPESNLQRNLHFQEEPTVMNNPNCPNPTEYMGNLSYEEALSRALALSVGEEVGGGDVVACEPNTEPAQPTTTLPTTRDLSKVEFDLVIEEICEPQTAKPISIYEEKRSELVVPDFLTEDDLKVEGLGSVDLCDAIQSETNEEWLERLKRTNVVTERDHMLVDIFID